MNNNNFNINCSTCGRCNRKSQKCNLLEIHLYCDKPNYTYWRSSPKLMNQINQVQELQKFIVETYKLFIFNELYYHYDKNIDDKRNHSDGMRICINHIMDMICELKYNRKRLLGYATLTEIEIQEAKFQLLKKNYI